MRKTLLTAYSIFRGGGEPTLAGLSFFQDFAAYARERRPEGTELAFTMQTNGLELEDDFLDFLKKEQLLVGVSLDGPKRIHDRNRTLGNREGNIQAGKFMGREPEGNPQQGGISALFLEHSQ